MVLPGSTALVGENPLPTQWLLHPSLPSFQPAPLLPFSLRTSQHPPTAHPQPSLPVLGGSVCPPEPCPPLSGSGHPSGKSPLPSSIPVCPLCSSIPSAAHPPALRSKDSSSLLPLQVPAYFSPPFPQSPSGLVSALS